MNLEEERPSWDEYFLMLAKLAATRSTCLAFPVGAVITKNRQVLATGYNGSPSGSAHCTTQGFCYPGLSSCDASKFCHQEQFTLKQMRSPKRQNMVYLLLALPFTSR